MATTLVTVADFVAATREFLQDNAVEYRHSDNDILLGLNSGLQEAGRLCQYLFRNTAYVVPTYNVVDSTAVNFSARHRPALLYFIIGWLQLRGDDRSDDARASAFIDQFRKELVGDA